MFTPPAIVLNHTVYVCRYNGKLQRQLQETAEAGVFRAIVNRHQCLARVMGELYILKLMEFGGRY